MNIAAPLMIIRDVVLAISALGAAAFYVAPPAERLFVETFGIRAWYWAAEYAVNGEGIAQADALNFHHGLILQSIKLCENSCSRSAAVKALSAHTSEMVGDIVYATVSNRTHPVPGRAEPNSRARQKTLAEAFSCHRVREVLVKIGGPNAEHPYNIYLKLIRTPCL